MSAAVMRGVLRAARRIAVAALLTACAAQQQAVPQAASPPGPSPAAHAAAVQALYPPWQHGTNNDAANQGLAFTVPAIDVLADFHGDPEKAALVLYVGGNYYFAMAPLVQAFGQAYPQYRGKVYYETLPPGILEKQMQAGGTITVGNMTWTARPDAYLAGLRKVNDLIHAGMLTSPAVSYVTNNLTIMVPAGNPGHVTGLRDLGRPEIAVVLPNPQWEGVARQIRASLVKAGGEALAAQVYDAKVKDGTTILTRVHHRQTPLFLMQGLAEAGVTWKSEAVFQEQAGHPIADVTIPPEQNTTAIYAGAAVKGALHRGAAQDWLRFIRSETALTIFERYGFKRYQPDPAKAEGAASK
jgi:ABC-type molybdate transport system substrate-binding protein